jgi:hypothetical protein
VTERGNFAEFLPFQSRQLRLAVATIFNSNGHTSVGWARLADLDYFRQIQLIEVHILGAAALRYAGETFVR